MASDFSKPVATDTYATLLPALVTKFSDIICGLDPALTGTATNLPTGAKRFNESSALWERYNGTSWSALSALYAINISGNAATATSAGSATTATTANALNTANIYSIYALNVNGNTTASGRPPIIVNDIASGLDKISFQQNGVVSGLIRSSAASPFAVVNAAYSSEVMSVDNSGNLHCATSAITGHFTSTDTGSNVQFGGAATVGFYVDTTNIAIRTPGTNTIFFQNTGGGVTFGTISSSGFSSTNNVTAYSDERLKTNWRDLPEDFVQSLAKVKTGIYDRTDIESTQVGVSAQSLRPLMPNAVIENGEGVLAVAYGNAALAACVMLARKVEYLETRLKALEA